MDMILRSMFRDLVTNLKDESWREFMQHCTKGRIRTYTQRYQNDP